MNNIFITATSTDVGKTFLGERWVRHLRGEDRNVVAIKPIETGCNPLPQDASRLAIASANNAYVHHPGFYRARPALGPASIALMDHAPELNIVELKKAIVDIAKQFDICIVEGAGGVAVPLNSQTTIADLIAALEMPTVLLAPDRLGVQSDVLSSLAYLDSKSVDCPIVVLNRHLHDDSSETNAAVLREITGRKVAIMYHDESPSADFWDEIAAAF